MCLYKLKLSDPHLHSGEKEDNDLVKFRPLKNQTLLYQFHSWLHDFYIFVISTCLEMNEEEKKKIGF